jgi:hypothetical protein
MVLDDSDVYFWQVEIESLRRLQTPPKEIRVEICNSVCGTNIVHMNPLRFYVGTS